MQIFKQLVKIMRPLNAEKRSMSHLLCSSFRSCVANVQNDLSAWSMVGVDLKTEHACTPTQRLKASQQKNGAICYSLEDIR